MNTHNTRNTKSSRSHRGFTLVEMMISIALLSLLMAVAVPSFRGMMMKNRSQTTINTLMLSLNLARSEAVKRNQQVALCKSADGATCTTAGAWEQGWLVFVDLDQDGVWDAVVVDDANTTLIDESIGGEEIIRVEEAFENDFTLTSTTATDWFAYGPDGSGRSSGGLVNGTFLLCPSDGDEENANRVVTNITGRPLVKEGAPSCP